MSTVMGSCGPDLQALYESLRAQAINHRQSSCLLQGMELLTRSGLPAWMVAWTQVAASTSVRSIGRRDADVSSIPASRNHELVPVLAAMVRASRRRSA